MENERKKVNEYLKSIYKHSERQNIYRISNRRFERYFCVKDDNSSEIIIAEYSKNSETIRTCIFKLETTL